jgi:hypothetical protein
MVRGNHQYGFGGAMAMSDWKTESNVRSMGPISFSGGVTGLPLADFLLGRVFEFREATPFRQDIKQPYFALYGRMPGGCRRASRSTTGRDGSRGSRKIAWTGRSSPLTVTTGTDRALSGIQATTQRATQVLDNPYGDKTINNWLNPAAFAQPALGTYGNLRPQRL